MKDKFDVIVIGGGHAGIEAATASARLEAKTLLISIKKSDIGEMSCNPAIGGIGKGHIVREIDALDGCMSKIIDKAGIQFRMLNKSKGVAVQGPRAQADRDLYRKYALETIENYSNLTFKEDLVTAIKQEANGEYNLTLRNGEQVIAKAIVLTTGTFLNGVIHIGDITSSGGRFGEEASFGLSSFLKEKGLELGRLKTGTPARLKKSSIDFSVLEEQFGDENPEPFSYLNKEITTPQITCFITHTNEKTHEVIRKNINKSAVYSGNITGKGPRYCPSIEDKIVRFSDKDKHQIFLEPEGLNSDVIYPNGISTSLPEDVQFDFLHTMKGLENVEIIRYGYAIEYDFVNPQELKPTLETKKVKNLFLAGQINGTTGYEEAAGQGLIAGSNAALNALEKNKEFTLERDQSYIGVMINDLITQGVNDPYRMFTSRAEYRIMLRVDNADIRLTQKGIDVGLVGLERKNEFLKKKNLIDSTKKYLEGLIITPNKLQEYNINVKLDGVKRSALDLLSYNSISTKDIINIWADIEKIDSKILDIVKNDSLYKDYVLKQQEEIRKLKKDYGVKIPDDFDYNISGLSSELKEKFNNAKPNNLGEASLVRGATPAAIIAIFMQIKKLELEKNKNVSRETF